MRVNLLTRLFTCLVDASPVAVSSAGPPPLLPADATASGELEEPACTQRRKSHPLW